MLLELKKVLEINVSFEYLIEKSMQVEAHLIEQEIDDRQVTAYESLANINLPETIIHKPALADQLPKLLPYSLLLLILIFYR